MSSSLKKLAVAVGAAAIVVSTPVTGAWAAGEVSGDASGKGLRTQSATQGEQHPARHAQGEEQRTVARTVGSGSIDGKEWSVTLQFYPAVPEDFPAVDRTSGFGDSRPENPSLLCQRVFIGGVQVDHQAGPWAGCSVVDGRDDFVEGAGLHGLTGKGTSGTRIFVGNPSSGTATARLTLDGGTVRTAEVVTLPGTSYRAFALPIADGETIASVDTFDGQGNRLTHETYWD
ncbi:hypothetical protein [Streptomyces sp. CB02414]|uniref:hypothetical protein n=1 Tax=Streptomyces sp. CB02414 TaxID=1703922 RepID=UPI00093D5FA5|nr:hypothetical protein [Streptomyces sp. CB02414]OKI86383.1 hypothetical protein AMK11_16520 [Streptomyces sp. CB02414]